MRTIKKYGSTHDWIKRWFGKSDLCEHCCSTTEKKYEWANISGDYKRDRKDWLRLCTSCHHKYDNRAEKSVISRMKKGKECKDCGKITTSKYQLCRLHLKKMFNKRRTTYA